MKKSLAKLVALIAASVLGISSVSAQSSDWASAAAPVVKKVEQTGPNELKVTFESAATPKGGADKGFVSMKSNTGASSTEAFGRTRKAEKSVTFEMKKSGTYTFTVTDEKKGQSEKHVSKPFEYKYVLPLTKSTVTALNVGDSSIEIQWTEVDEATGYILSYTDVAGKTVTMPETTDTSATVQLKDGIYSKISVKAVRGGDSSTSDVLTKLVKKDAERIWAFTEFGTSTKVAVNRMEMIDPNNLKLKLYSCTYDPKTGNIIDKGGKYESFFDGMSFYYTKIDPRKENFELTCTITVDYHNPMTDGQEGFGVLALDQLGVDGQPMMIAYNNSAGIVSRKFTTHVNGVKKEIKNGIGARAVTGITEGIIAEGDAAIKSKCSSLYQAFSYDQGADAIKTGDVYRVTLKKDNTGYHSIYKRAIPSVDTVEEYILYDNKNVKLLQLDNEFIYVGFSVARGCNATFSDVVFKTSDPKLDPPGDPEPPELVPLKVTIDCPTTYSDSKYPFAFISNAKGTIHVEDKDGKVVIANDPIEADKYYKKTLKIKVPSITDLNVTFTPEAGWKPGENAVIAQYDADNACYKENYKSVTYMHSIASLTYKGKVLYVDRNGSIFGTGSKDDPIDIDSAIKYMKPGQTALLLPGKYYPTKSIQVERGNDGTAKARKVLKSADPNNRAIFDFSTSKASVTAFNLFGNYWTIENIDITQTPGDCKALQVGGSYNEIRMVDTYLNGDTGIQIAGRSAESSDMWPHHNIIYGCESFGNSDPAQNNADGFASKLTSGEGNKFINCVSHHNVDDGWDLYSKVETGPIGAVLLENCIAYANGTKLDLSGKGDGNGFKLGGDGIAIKHVLRNSVAWDNGTNGVTCNSNPALILDRVTVSGSVNYNINLYGKGKADQYPRIFESNGALSVNGGSPDNYKERKEIESENNFFFNGAKAQNIKGESLTAEEAFVSTDTEKYANGYNEDGTFNRIPRNAQGVFDLGDLFRKTDKVPAGVGADYNNNSYNAK